MSETKTSPSILPIILAGGIGARLAPISTEARPKPFVPLRDGESLLTKTLARVKGGPFLPPVIIGRAANRFALINHARAAGVAPQAILLEQNPKNTAAAVALGALWAERNHGENTCLAILPADHLITPDDAWHATIIHAAQASQQSGSLCLLAAAPTGADPEFGYLILGPGSARRTWQLVTRFVEKPDAPASLLAHGARWNMGQFIGTAAQFRQAGDAAIPDIMQAASELLDQAPVRWEFTELPAWPDTVAPISFDRAVIEKNTSVAVPYTGQWQDLGTSTSWEVSTGLRTQDYAQKPPRTDRPWGYFEHIAIKPNEVLKRLILYPGCRLSRQRHQKRAEHWRVLAGTAYVELEDSVQRLEIEESITIPAGKWHRLANHHDNILIIEERQMGICDEADIERADDDYGRN